MRVLMRYAVVLSVILAAIAGTPFLAQGVCDGVSPVQTSALSSVDVITGLSRPLLVTAPPGDTDRLFALEQDGVIRVWHRGNPTGTHTAFLDITTRVNSSFNEQGLLGLAFDPNYSSNGYFYVNYTRPVSGSTTISRFQVSAGDPDVADPTTETVLMSFAQPEDNHNGGHLEFGPDGFLYISTGDGGGGNDGHGACGNGQDKSNLLGAILRIDPSGASGGSPDCSGGSYSVPSDNPFVDGSGGDCDEIWAYGLRNPWRFSFDAAGGDVYIGDVGQGCWEEINWVDGQTAGGENYGWRQMEGTHCFNPNVGGCDPPNLACGTSPDCNDPSLTIPIVEFDSTSFACSVTGGYVYRGCKMPRLSGRYFYGDYCSGEVLSFVEESGVASNPVDYTSQVDPGGLLLFALTSFGTDAQGEVYVVDRTGQVRKFLPPVPALEVSGNGVNKPDMLLLNRDTPWTWEDLHFTTMQPVDYYQVYRGDPGGTFNCIHSSASPDWALGDPADPLSGELFAYVITAVDGSEETQSGNPPRTLTNPCGPPP